MDPLSTAASIVAVLQLSATVVQYTNAALGGSKDRKRLRQELRSCEYILNQLNDGADDAEEGAAWTSTIHALQGADGPLKRLEVTFEVLKDMLAPKKGLTRSWRTITWPLKEKDVDKIMDSIEREKSLLNLALTNDSHRLVNDIKRTARENADQVSVCLSALHSMTEATLAAVETLKSSQQSNDMNAWLNPCNPLANLQRAQQMRFTGTGTWLLEHATFQEWKSNLRPHIWLHGIPGCGKTVLSAKVIEHLYEEQAKDNNSIVLVFFFDFTDSSKSTLDQLLRSLLAQLYAASPASRSMLETMRQEWNQIQGQPATHHFAETFLNMAKMTTGKIRVVLDALDECRTRKQLLAWIMGIVSTQHSHNIQFAMTSRRDEDIERALYFCVSEGDSINLHADLLHRDIKAYVHGTLHADNEFQRWASRPDILKETETGLIQKAEGMFRWVACQLDTLQNCVHTRALRKALASLPTSLDDTYSRILNNIGDEHRDDAVRLLQFLCFSERPLSIEEAIDAIAINLEDGYFDPKDRMPDPRDIAKICSGLILLTPEGNTSPPMAGVRIQLAHFSVKEYLVSSRVQPAFREHFLELIGRGCITRACLTYIADFDGLSAGCDIRSSFPLADYAARSWTAHGRYAESDQTTLQCITRFFTQSTQAYANWMLLFDPDEPWESNPHPHRRLGSHVYYAALAGLSRVVRELLDAGMDANAKDGANGSALQAACLKGHIGVVEVLLGGGADANAKGGLHGDSLSAACFRGDEEIVSMLLANKASCDLENPLNALHISCTEGHEKIVGMLLDSESNLSQHAKNGKALKAPSFRRYKQRIQRQLTERFPAILSEDTLYGQSDYPGVLANDEKALFSTLLPRDDSFEVAEEIGFTWRVGLQDGQDGQYSLLSTPGVVNQAKWSAFITSIGDPVNKLSLYLERLYDPPKVDSGRHSHDKDFVTFAFVVWKPEDPTTYIARIGSHYYHPKEPRWGFENFCSLPRLIQDLTKGRGQSLEDLGAVNVTVLLRARGSSRDSISYSGNEAQAHGRHVGLVNKYYTGWLNVILQSHFYITALRKAVYRTPVDESADPDVTLAIQRQFYLMQTSVSSVTTDELIDAVGYRRGPADVQDAERQFDEMLERLMVGTTEEKQLESLFAGVSTSYYSSLNTDHGSKRLNPFWDIQLEVSDHRSLHYSLQDYIRPWMVDDWLVQESKELHRASRGVAMERFPPVLRLQLKRFEYNLASDRMEKLDKYFEFPEEIDLEPYLSFQADRSEPWIYRLTGVVTHEGSINGGVYYVYVRTTKDGPFYKFFNEEVTLATLTEAMADNFGGSGSSPSKQSRTAYMLHYCRVSRLDDIYVDITDDDRPVSTL